MVYSKALAFNCPVSVITAQRLCTFSPAVRIQKLRIDWVATATLVTVWNVQKVLADALDVANVMVGEPLFSPGFRFGAFAERGYVMDLAGASNTFYEIAYPFEPNLASSSLHLWIRNTSGVSVVRVAVTLTIEDHDCFPHDVPTESEATGAGGTGGGGSGGGGRGGGGSGGSGVAS